MPIHFKMVGGLGPTGHLHCLLTHILVLAPLPFMFHAPVGSAARLVFNQPGRLTHLQNRLQLRFSVLLGNALFNGNAPASNAYYSTAVTRWFTALTAQQRVFKLPFQTAGSCWQAPILRLLGAKIGRRFFCLNELVLVDAPFTQIGDDVTVDYDGQVRCHSFEDFRLKFKRYTIGSKVRIMAGASVAMCNLPHPAS